MAGDTEIVRLAGRLVQYDQALDEIESEMAMGFEETGEVPMDALSRFEAFVAEKKEHVDRAVIWLNELENRIEHMFDQSKHFKSIAEQGQLALSGVKARMTEVLAPEEEDGDPRKLEGDTYKIWAQRNGGQEAVAINDETQIPREYYDRRGSISFDFDDEMGLASIRSVASEIGIDLELKVSFNCADETSIEKLRDTADAFGADFSVEKDATIALQRIREVIEKGGTVPGCAEKLHRGHHVRWSKIKSKAVAKKKAA